MSKMKLPDLPDKFRLADKGARLSWLGPCPGCKKRMNDIRYECLCGYPPVEPPQYEASDRMYPEDLADRGEES